MLWQDASGRERVTSAQLVDISVGGLKVRVDEAVPVRSYIICNDHKLGISGRGAVRYCNYLKGKYEIGVEFSGGTGWHEPDAVSPDVQL